jgi:hypothetical protein
MSAPTQTTCCQCRRRAILKHDNLDYCRVHAPSFDPYFEDIDLVIMHDLKITHSCFLCGRPLTADWPYAACVDCGKKRCPHGNDPANCGACDLEGDFAFNAARDGR